MVIDLIWFGRLVVLAVLPELAQLPMAFFCFLALVS